MKYASAVILALALWTTAFWFVERFELSRVACVDVGIWLTILARVLDKAYQTWRG